MAPKDHGNAAQTGMQNANVNGLQNDAMTRKPVVASYWQTEFERVYNRVHQPFFTPSTTSHDDARRHILLGANHADHAKQ